MQGSVRKRGTTWSYYFDIGIVDGKRKRKEKGGFRTKKDAQLALNTTLSEFNESGLLTTENNISFSDYLDYWYSEYVLVNCKYNTQLAYKIILNKHLKPVLGDYKLKTISSQKLQEFINNKYRNAYTKNSILNFYGVLSCSFKMAVHPYEYIKNNPMKYVQMPKIKDLKKDKTDFKLLSLDNFNKIIKRFPEGSSFYIPLQIAFNTVLRASEVCALTWNNINFIEQTITVEKIIIKKERVWFFDTPKTSGSSRIIKIGNTLLQILKKHKETQEKNIKHYEKFYENTIYKFDINNKTYTSKYLICTKENGQLVSTESLKYLSRIVNYELGIPFNFHSLRHTHATMLLEGGANIKDIQHRLGHTRLSTTMDIYSHVTQKMKTDSVDIFERIIATN